MTRRIVAAVLCIGLLAGAAATAEAARNYKSGTYRGQTAQGAKVSLKVLKSKMALIKFSWEGASLSCSDGNTRSVKGDTSPGNLKFPITSKGKFKLGAANESETLEFDIRGQLKKSKAKGVLQVQARINEQNELDPEGTISCDSELVQWSAKRR